MSDNVMTPDTIKNLVRARYGDIAASANSSCSAPATTSCCAPAAAPDLTAKAREIGYSDEELEAVPEAREVYVALARVAARNLPVKNRASIEKELNRHTWKRSSRHGSGC